MSSLTKQQDGVAASKLTKLFDESTISVRVEELAREAASRLPDNFVVVGLLIGSLCLSPTSYAPFIASAAIRQSNSCG